MNWRKLLHGATWTTLLVILLTFTTVSCARAPVFTQGATIEKLDDTHYKVNNVWLYQQREAGELLLKELALCRGGLK